MKVLVLDNYDSFTYNLVQYLGELKADVTVHRNDQITLEQIHELNPDRIVISPGPGIPRNAGISIDLIREFAGKVPLLGVCLGHQAIGEAFGGRVIRAPELKHGKTSMIHHQGDSIFSGLPAPFEATRYHSLIVERETLPESLIVNAYTEDNLIMGLRHCQYDIFGVQFHPESVLTRPGKQLLENFLCCRS
ncbi:MAG: anthranilate synthase component II [Acidobacteriota bacterium]